MNENDTPTKKKFNHRIIICIVITIGFFACFFRFPNSLGRLIESARDLGLSIAYYFCEMFGIENSITPTVVNLPQIPLFPFPSILTAPTDSVSLLPSTWSGFKQKWSAYWKLWASKNNFVSYLNFLSRGIIVLCEFIVIATPFIVITVLIFKRYMKTQNNDYNRDSKPLRAFKWFTAHALSPAVKWCKSMIAYIKEHRAFIRGWVAIWLFYFNAYTIVLEFLAFYFYFIVAFDIGSIYIQVYKLFIDLSAILTFIPVWVWGIIGIILFDRFRKKIGYARLNHMERRNRGFINALPIVSMIDGTMGTGKTTTDADMGLSISAMFRDTAFKKILENDLKFPYFPWINLENAIQREMKKHTVYNLATVRKFIALKAMRWQKRPTVSRLFDYDYNRYGLEYNDNLQIVNVWEIIEIYAQLYFIYIIQSSLIIANYSVRTDEIMSDVGNFPLWNTDFFRRDTRLMDAYSRHAHILDFDSLRLGKKIIRNNRNADGFEFGIILITEIGKERGNNLENKEVKKVSDDTNQKNDGLNRWLKMVRHSATVDNFPFVKVITDEQRPESWGADARDLCKLVHLCERSETRLSMPFFSIAELFYAWLFGKFSDIYYEYRFTRSDNTLFMYLLKGITAKLHHYYSRIYNQFGYNVLKAKVENGTQDGQATENKYFIMAKKIYSRRFSTDCFSDFFAQKVLRSSIGIDDLPEYETEKATFAELQMQNSYFINDLTNSMRDDNNEKEKQE